MHRWAGHVADRRAFVSSLATGLLLVPLAARAAAATRVVRIGLLTPSSISPRGPMACVPPWNTMFSSVPTRFA